MNRTLIRVTIVSVFAASVVAFGSRGQAPASVHAIHGATLVKTIKVTAKSDGSSTITWTGSFTPDQGKEKAATEALGDVYEAGLTEIQAKLAK